MNYASSRGNKTKTQTKYWRLILFATFLFGLLGVFLGSERTANANPTTDIVVNTTLDEHNPNDGLCSLREAALTEWTLAASGPATGECPAPFGNANDNIILPEGTFTLTDTVAGPIYLYRDELLIGASVPGMTTIIQGGAGWNTHILAVDSAAHLRIWHVTIRGGNSSGGGGIAQTGTLDLRDSIITNNHADGSGGGIYNTGILTITDSTIQLNTANGGAGLFSSGSGARATLINTNVLSNTATFGAAGIYGLQAAALNITGGSIISNTAQSSGGGGILVDSTSLAISGTVLSKNTAGPASQGGGIYGVMNSTIFITNTTIDGNSSYLGAGITYGGTGTLHVNASSITNNIAGNGGGGGMNVAGTTYITNTTISSNQAGTAGGGGIISSAHFMAISYSTIVDNQATGGSPGGIRAQGVAAYLRSTILASNSGASGNPDCLSAITSWGYNLIGNNAGCGFVPIASDQVGTSAHPIDPRISTLGNHGGPTQTHALLTTSPALSVMLTGTNGCGTLITTDQRGFPRPRNGKCNIGAYEGVLGRLYLPLLLR